MYILRKYWIFMLNENAPKASMINELAAFFFINLDFPRYFLSNLYLS